MGLPKEVAEKYYDASKTPHEEHFLGKVLNFYTIEGYLKEQQHYDAKDIHRYTLYWEYDAMGNVVEERDALGRVIRRNLMRMATKFTRKALAKIITLNIPTTIPIALLPRRNFVTMVNV